MKIFDWERLKTLRGLLATERPEPVQQAERIAAMQRDVVLPSKAGVCLVVLSYLFFSGWQEDPGTRSVALDTLKHFFEIYLACTLLGAFLFIYLRRLPAETFLWLAFTLGLLDGLFMAGLIIVTGGFGSIAFWVFPALIVLNALSIPLAMPQIVLNVLLSLIYMVAVVSTPSLSKPDETVVAIKPRHVVTGVHGTNHTNQPFSQTNAHETIVAGAPRFSVTGTYGTNYGTNHQTNDLAARFTRVNVPNNNDADSQEEEIGTEQLLLRVAVLWLLTLCCYGAQVLSERQREAIQDAAEFATREGQLHSAGRLAAEFAHQIKNPLAIINNASYSLRRSLGESKNSASQQIEIIQEEVARVDRVITQIMGYAQLSEGRVEKLKVVEEIDRACEQVFPRAVPTTVKLKKKLSGPFPPLFMQRGHLSEILVNLLQNAREVLNGGGNVSVTASSNRDHDVEISVMDDGPGIPPDKIGRIFEAYFTTKEKGTGLGLAIVKHTTELYGGTVRVDSVLGKGSKFTVSLPAKLQPKPFIK